MTPKIVSSAPPSAAIAPLIGWSLIAKTAMHPQVMLLSGAPFPRFDRPW